MIVNKQSSCTTSFVNVFAAVIYASAFHPYNLIAISLSEEMTTTVSSQTPLHGHGALARMGLAEYGNAVKLPGTSILLVSWYLQ